MINNLKAGDIVAIRGDKRINNNGKCAYDDSQLIDNKYLRHSSNGGLWYGAIERISSDGEMAKIGGGWYGVNSLELVSTIYDNNRAIGHVYMTWLAASREEIPFFEFGSIKLAEWHKEHRHAVECRDNARRLSVRMEFKDCAHGLRYIVKHTGGASGVFYTIHTAIAGQCNALSSDLTLLG